MKALRKTRTLLLVVSAALALIPALASSAWAIKRCNPVTVGAGHFGACIVTNYGTSPDIGVTITLYDADGVVIGNCDDQTIPPKASRHCQAFTPVNAIFSCEVKGEGSLARASLLLFVPETADAVAVAECR